MKTMNLKLIFLLLFLFGCTTTKMTSSWKAENVKPQVYKKILVLGLINEPDRTIREKMEEQVVSELGALGYKAVCSCNEFDPKTFENLNEKEALARLGESGIDAVLTIVLLDKQKERYYIPDRIYYSPFIIYHNHFWGYYHTMYQRVYGPGYYNEDTKYFWESNLYSLEGKELLYSGQSQSFDPGSAKSLAIDYGKMIVKDMIKNNILVSRPG